MPLSTLPRLIQQGFEVHAPACILPFSSPASVAVSAALTAYQMYRGSFVGTLISGAFLLSSGSLYQTEQISPQNVRQKLNDLFVEIAKSLKRNNFQEALFVERFNKVQKVLTAMQGSFDEVTVRSQNERMTEISALITSPINRAVWQIERLDGEMKAARWARRDGTFEAQKGDFIARYNAAMALYNQHPRELAGMTELLKVMYEMITPNVQTVQLKIDNLKRELAQSRENFWCQKEDFEQRYVDLHGEVEALLPQSRDLLRPRLEPIHQRLNAAIPFLRDVIGDARRNRYTSGQQQLTRYAMILRHIKHMSAWRNFNVANFVHILSGISAFLHLDLKVIQSPSSLVQETYSGKRLIAIVPVQGSATWLYHRAVEGNRLFKVPEWTMQANGAIKETTASESTDLDSFKRNNPNDVYAVYANHPDVYPHKPFCSGSIPNRFISPLLRRNPPVYPDYSPLVSAIHIFNKILPANFSLFPRILPANFTLLRRPT